MENLMQEVNTICELNKIHFNRMKSHIDKYKQIVDSISKINDDDFTMYYEEIVKILTILSDITNPIFQIHEELEENFKIKYAKSPAIGELKYQIFIKKIHNPYDTLKNRCYAILDKLDNTYIKSNKKNPPNWNI